MSRPEDGRAALCALLAGSAAPAPALAAELEAAFQPRSLARRQGWVAPGEALPLVLFVVRGLLRFYAVDAEGAEWNKGFAAERDLTGPFVTGAADWPAPHGVQALEATRLLVCERGRFEALVRRDPALERRLSAQVAALLERKARRLLSFQQEDAAGRYRAFLAGEPELARRLPQLHVASYLGISEVSLSRLRRKLRTGSGAVSGS